MNTHTTSTERSRTSRLKKAAKSFSEEYLNGVSHTTTELFLEAVKAQICYENNVAEVYLNDGVVTDFIRAVGENLDDAGEATIAELITSYNDASEEMFGERALRQY